ncbi:uncharacterized protein LOC130780455 [Actinidia eriantha]|uniref:uncharacterized protein LOC130780455 n=1 Tax=Actinidia eriantha TaxID=165200 RepID=UPI002589DF85|nr:uncharacterized protein LOC130780455 [Actinidia eriantha]
MNEMSKTKEMDYERIEKRSHQASGGLSPGKLTNMLLGGERKRTQGELESTYSLRSQVSEIDDSGGGCSDNCKDVDVVSVLPEFSVSTRANSFPTEMICDRSLNEHSSLNSRTRSQDDNSLDFDIGHDNMSVSSSVFEFLKEDRVPQRVPLAPTFSKPTPSKWDDAQKWIASPTSNRQKSWHPQGHGGSRKASNFGYGSRQPSMKVVVEVPDPSLVPFEEPDTKRIDSSQAKKENGAKFVSWEAEPYPLPESYRKEVVMIENCVGESAINLSRHDASVSIHSATTFIPPPSTARSVSMRDMGTEMTPIASQEPSRNGTPVRATTPIRSPTSSRTSTPQRVAPTSSPIGLPNDHLDLNKKELSEKELQMKTRREIMALGTQLGKMNIAAWASKEEEDNDASMSLKTVRAEQPAKSVIETCAAAWEESENAKYMARFKREETKIQAWENHQKAKTEAEMRKIEVEVERMRGRAHDKLMNKLAAARHKAEEKRAAAEAKRNRQAAKTEHQAGYIRRTGRIPSSFSFCGWCCC